MAGALPQLVRVIENGSRVQRFRRACRHLGQQGRAPASLLRSGLTPLVNLLRTGSAKVQEEAAAALATLETDLEKFQPEIIKAGAITPLVAILLHGSAAVQASAAQALANAATTARSQEYVAGALTALASKHNDNRQVIGKRRLAFSDRLSCAPLQMELMRRARAEDVWPS